VRVIFSPLAALDIEEIGDYIFKENPRAARQITKELRARCRGLSDYPRRGLNRPDIEQGLRSISLGNYVIFYIIDAQTVRIQRILHGARDIPATMISDDAQ
jgi:toxin ParE1/3/4